MVTHLDCLAHRVQPKYILHIYVTCLLPQYMYFIINSLIDSDSNPDICKGMIDNDIDNEFILSPSAT